MDDQGTDDNGTYTVSLGDNEIDSACLGVDCYPASVLSDLPATAFLTRDKTLLCEVQLTFQALLDSACTHHIIKDQSLFWTYCSDCSLKVSTASSGMLQTKVQGLVKLEVDVQDSSNDTQTVVLSLHDCLHAPNAAMNLLSIGVELLS